MLKQKTVNFDDMRSCIVKEITIKHLKNGAAFLANNAQEMQSANPIEFMKTKWDEVYGLISDRFQFTGGDGLDDLSLSEVDQLIDAFVELHAGIGGKLGKLINLKTIGQTLQNDGSILKKT